MRIVAYLDGLENGKGKRGSAAGDVPGDHDGRAELAEGAGEGQDRPPAMPRAASGAVMVKNTRTGPAPSVCAICSRRGLTFSNAARAERTKPGKDITPKAINTARQVNTMSAPNQSYTSPPISPRRLRIFRRIRPVATGGMTIGSKTQVSTKDLPRHSRRASGWAIKSPGGRMTNVLSAETQLVNHVNCQSSALI